MKNEDDFASDEEFTWRINFDENEIRKRRADNETFFLPECGLKFIDDHFSLRPSCLHVLLGSTGRGKSTLVQSLILEWGKKANLLLYLTEESVERLENKLFEKEENSKYLSSKLNIIHEQDVLKTLNPNDYIGFCLQLETKIQATNPKALIFDNLTTSLFYENKFKNIMPLLGRLREIAAKYKIPIFLITHTKKGINENKGIIMPDDVRGSASLALTADYFYIMYRIQYKSKMGSSYNTAFIYVAKSRDHGNQDFIYRLDYDIAKKRYTKDTMVSFEIFKEAMKDRNKI